MRTRLIAPGAAALCALPAVPASAAEPAPGLRAPDGGVAAGGARPFSAVLKGWPAEHRYGYATIEDFVRFAERVPVKPLDGLFETWLCTPGRPSAHAAAEARIAPDGKASRPGSWLRMQATNRAHPERTR